MDALAEEFFNLPSKTAAEAAFSDETYEEMHC